MLGKGHAKTFIFKVKTMLIIFYLHKYALGIWCYYELNGLGLRILQNSDWRHLISLRRSDVTTYLLQW